MQDLAQEAGWQPWELTRRFQRAYGMTPGDYRRQARVERALELLVQSDTTIARVAADSGFYDQSHLARELRLATGLSANAFRRLSLD